MTQQLRDAVRDATRKSNFIECTILTYGGGYASVAVGRSGRVMHGIKVIGGIPYLGETADIDYSTDVPVVRSRSNSEGQVIVQYQTGISGAMGEGTNIGGVSPPPQVDWFSAAGWTIGTDGSITSLTGDTVIKTNGEIVLGTGNDLAVMTSADALYRIYIGNATPASAKFSVTKAGLLKSTSADIGGWNIDATTIYDNTSAIVLDSANATIDVGIGTPNLVIDGSAKQIKSSNWNGFGSGAGFGMDGGSGDAEFNDVYVRGTIRASVFNIGEITATAGTSGVWKSASKIYEDVTIPSNGNDVDIKAENSDADPYVPLFANGDVVRIKAWNGSSIVDVWGEIESTPTNFNGYSTYDVRIRSGGSVAVKKGTAMVSYGQSLDGFITMSADGTVGASANISISEVRKNYINTVSVSAGGTGYEVGDTLWVHSGVAASYGWVEVKTLSGSAVLTVAIGGVGYDNSTGVKGTSHRTGSGGSGCGINITDVNDPWDATFLKLRIGNMRSSYGVGAVDRYGVGIGDYDAKNYISFNAETADALVISAGDGKVLLSAGGISMRDTESGAPEVSWFYDSTYYAGGVYGDYAGGAATDAIMWLRAYRQSGNPWDNVGVILAAVDSVNSKDARVWLSTAGSGATFLQMSGIAKVQIPDGSLAVGALLGASDGDITYNGNLRPYRNSSYYTSYTFVPKTTPGTHTSWDGDPKSDASGSGAYLNMTAFGVPAYAKAVLMQMMARDSAGWSASPEPPADMFFAVGPSLTYWYALSTRPIGEDVLSENTGPVPTDGGVNSRVYYRIEASGTSTMDCWVRIWGYWI